MVTRSHHVNGHGHGHGKKVAKKKATTTEQLARLFVILLGVAIGASLIYLLVARLF